MNTPLDDNSTPKPEFPFKGERGEALIALLGPKALGELRILLRLADSGADGAHTQGPAEETSDFREAA